MPIGDRVVSKKELETLSRNLSRQIKAVRSHAVSGYKTFLDLEDTPDSFSGQAGKSIVVDSSEKILEFKSFAFLDLSDTPVSFIGEAGKLLKVNAGEDAIEFGVFGDLSLEVLGTPTYKTLQDWLNLTQSAGKTTVGDILSSHAGPDGTLDVAAGTGFIKTTDSPVGVTKFFDWEAKNLALADNLTNYIYVDYTTGVPEAKATTTRADIEWNRHFTLGRAYRSGNDVHVVNSGTDLTNSVRRNHERLVGVRGFERDSGGVISESGERFLESTAGVFWLGATRIVTLLQNTNNGDRFTKWYPVAGVWNSTGGQQQVDNAQYSDGTDLQNLTPNKYGTMWCYIDYDSHLHVVYGLQNGTLTAARAADPPDVPAFIRDFAILAARIIIQQGAANIVEFESSFVTFFPHTTPSEHVDLGGLQGGTAAQYYHLTNAEHTELATIATLGRGIADDNIVQIDSATIADNDYAKFTANGLEGRSYAEVLADLSGEALAAFDWNGQNLTNLGTGHDAFSDFVANEHIDYTAVLDAAAKVVKTTAKARAYLAENQFNVTHVTWTKILLDTESYDSGANFDLVNHRFVAPVSGYYAVTAKVRWGYTVAGSYFYAAIYVDGATINTSLQYASVNDEVLIFSISDIVYLAQNSWIELWCYNGSGVDTPDILGNPQYVFLAVHQLSV